MCLEVSVGTWEFKSRCFISDRRLPHVLQKTDTELGQAPKLRTGPRDTDYLRPSNLAARTLSLVEHSLFKCSRAPFPVRRGIVAAVKCCARKTLFFPVSAGYGTEQEKPEPCVGFKTTKEKTSYFILGLPSV